MHGRAARDLDIAKRDPFSRNKFLGGDISIFEKIAVVGGAEIGDGKWWGRRPGTGTSIGHGGAAWGGERGGGGIWCLHSARGVVEVQTYFWVTNMIS